MKNNTIYTTQFTKGILAFFLMATLFTACSSDNNIEEEIEEPTIEEPIEEPDEEEETTNYNKLLRVENFGYMLEDGNEFEDKSILYYSLVNNKEVPIEYRKTTQWDLAFSGLYSSFMSGNNGSHTGNFGAGTAAVGGIYIVEQPFDEVIEIPSDDVFKTDKEIYWADENGSFGEGIGWYFYDFDGIFVRDGAYDNMHIAYALGETLVLANGQTIPARTLIVRTAKGDYAKIKMISVYKDIFNREDFTRKAPKMYFTFEYVVVPKGSAQFEIKE